MAEIKFACPKCKQRVLVDDSAAGMEIGCPSCKAELIIPSANNSVALFAKPQAEESAAAKAELTQKQKEIERAQAELKTLREQLALSVAEQDRVKAHAEKRQRDLQEMFETAKADGHKREEELMALVTAAKSESDKHFQHARGIEEGLAKWQKNAESLRSDLDAANAKLADAANTNAELASAREMAKEAENLRAQVAEDRMRLSEMEKLRAELADAQVKLVEADKLRAELETAKASLAENEKIREVLDEAKLKLKESSTLRDELDEAKAQVKEHERWKTQADAANSQLSKLREELVALTVERDGAKSDAEKVRAGIESHQTELDRLRGELLETCEKLAAAERAHGSEGGLLRDQLSTFEERLAEANATIVLLREEVADLSKKTSEPSGDAAALAASRKETDDALQRMKEFAEQVAALRTQLTGAHSERDEARSLLAKKEAAHREISGRVDAARLSAKGALKAAAEAKTESDKAKAVADEATTRVRMLQGRITELEAELGQQNSQLAGARNAMHIAQSERDEAMKSHAPSEKEARELKSKLMQATTNEHTLRLQLEAAEKTAKSSTERLKGSETEREKLLARFAELGKNLDESNEQLATLRAERDAAAAKLERIESELAQAKDSLRSIGVEREAAKTELDSTRVGLERTKKHVGVLQDRVASLRADNERMRVQLGLAPEAAQ